MKNFFKTVGYVCLGVFAVLYFSFLFILPNVVKLEKFKPDIQKLVKDNSGLNIDYDKLKLVTSPFLEAGVNVDNINVTLPDESVIFTSDKFKAKIFIPALIFKSVRVSCAELDNPVLNAEIINGEKFKAAKAYEDMVNSKRAQRRLTPPKSESVSETPFDLSQIKIFIPAFKLNNYAAVIDDVKSGHKLSLKGEQIKLGYFNGKTVKLKADAGLLSDNDINVVADIDIDAFLPKFIPAREEVDDEAVYELPFINPVSVYRDYNLKSDVKAKLKIRKTSKNNKLWAKGFVNIGDTTVTLSGVQLPKSYFRLDAKGHKVEIDSTFYATAQEYLKLHLLAANGKNPFLDVSLKSPQVKFASLLNIAKAYLNTLHIKNDMDNMTANGYLLSNFRFKTDFSSIESDGKFIVRGGNIYHPSIGLILNNINANLLFDDNVFKVADTHALINRQLLAVSGQMGNNLGDNINIQADKIPIPALYLAFAPKNIKSAYDVRSGVVTLDAKVTGEIKNISAMLKADLEDLILSDRVGNCLLSNKSARLGVTDFNGDIKGKFTNSGFSVKLPGLNSVIVDDLITADISNKRITVKPSDIKVNAKSKITFKGQVSDYLSKPDAGFYADGFLADGDLKTLLGSAVAPYMDSKGQIPLKAMFLSKENKQKVIVQAVTDAESYITPVNFREFAGKKMLLQFLAEKNGDVVKLYKTGLYLRRPGAQFTCNLRKNIINTREVIGVRAIVSNLSTEPFINLFKITIPRDLNGTICAFNKSKFVFGGKLFAFGKLLSPKISGDFYIRNLTIPEILTSIRNINLDLNNRDVHLQMVDINANGSDININIFSNWKLLQDMKLAQVRVFSNLIDLDRLLKVSDALNANLPKSSTSASSSAAIDIPLEILGGNIYLRRITTGNIAAVNTIANISMFKNIFYINNLKTNPMGGVVTGDSSYNLATTELNAKVNGRNFDMEKVLLDVMAMKDTLSGNLGFAADISMKGVTQAEQLKSLKGNLDFSMSDGQLGPFGKFENFLMAENIRENAFFSSTIGSVITNIVTIDTSHFNKLSGRMSFDNGFADIASIQSQGNVMSMFITGKVGLVDNSADMKLRGKLASTFSDSLGPLANINPVNLIKNTPGLNIVAAKTFSVFCESVSEEEMKALPELGEGKTDDYATKFQIVLRGDTRKPLKMIKSFKWLALDSEIEAAQGFVDTLPVPVDGEETLSVQELIDLREQQGANTLPAPAVNDVTNEDKTFMKKIKSLFDKDRV